MASGYWVDSCAKSRILLAMSILQAWCMLRSSLRSTHLASLAYSFSSSSKPASESSPPVILTR